MQYAMKGTLIVFITACLFACSSPTSQTQQKQDQIPVPKDKIVRDVTGVKGGTLIVSESANLQTLNPAITIGAGDSRALGPVYLSLVGYDLETLEYSPVLAKSYKVSNGGKRFVFKLRQGLQWSDGTPFTMDDVVFSFEIVEKVELADIRNIFAQSDGSLPKFQKIDDSTFQIDFKEVNVLAIAAINGVHILPKHKWGKALEEGRFKDVLKIDTKPEDIVGMGPYIITEITPDQRMVYKRNPYYFVFDKNGQRLPYFNKVVRLVVPDDQTKLVKFRNGETDMHELEISDYDLLAREAKKSDFTIYDKGPALQSDYLSCLQHPGKRKDGTPIMEPWKYKLFSDKRFRQALSHSIDKEGLIKTVYHGRGHAFSTFTMPGDKTFYQKDMPPYAYDLEKAKALLAATGLKDHDGDGILEYEPGKPVSLRIHTNSNNARRIQIGNVIKEDFRKLGLKTRLIPIPFKSLIQLTDFTLDYDCYILGWARGTPPDPITSKNLLLSSGALHDWHAKQKTPHTAWEAEIDRLVGEFQSVFDIKKRVKIWREVEKIWYEQQPQTNIAVPTKYLAVKNKIGNAKPSAYRPHLEWNIDELYDKTLSSK